MTNPDDIDNDSIDVNINADSIIQDVERILPLLDNDIGLALRNKIELYRAYQTIDKIKEKYRYDDWEDLFDVQLTNSDFAPMYANCDKYLEIGDWTDTTYRAFMCANNYRCILDAAIGVLIDSMSQDIQTYIDAIPIDCKPAIDVCEEFLNEFKVTCQCDYRADTSTLLNLNEQQQFWKDTVRGIQQMKSIVEMKQEKEKED